MFQTSVLNKYLNNLDQSKVDEAYEVYRTNFLNAEKQKNIKETNEEQYQEGFLRELFVDVLGYTIKPTPNYNIETELKNIGNQRKTDAAILNAEQEAIAVIELKDTKTVIR